MELVKGYFTVERNIEGATLPELEAKLGFRPGRLSNGARILSLVAQPLIGQFVFAGSTRYSNAKGLVGIDQRANVAIPHAWHGQRLVKVAPNIPHTDREQYPRAESPVEQWELTTPVPAEEISRLNPGQVYWKR